uniref:Golgi transport 1Bb n=1 Tax=Labrus bergylta TaxID=56723 RepID=A0A3Q3LY04_9LABR
MNKGLSYLIKKCSPTKSTPSSISLYVYSISVCCFHNNKFLFVAEIGMGLTGFGVFFLFFGMMLFFDKALLAIGNILFVSGLSFVIGLERTFRFFFQRHKFKATSFFLGGVFVVLIGWPIIGVVLEIYGFFLLFRGFFPVAVGFIRRVPVLGSLLSLPGISALVDKIGESNTMV